MTLSAATHSVEQVATYSLEKIQFNRKEEIGFKPTHFIVVAIVPVGFIKFTPQGESLSTTANKRNNFHNNSITYQTTNFRNKYPKIPSSDVLTKVKKSEQPGTLALNLSIFYYFYYLFFSSSSSSDMPYPPGDIAQIFSAL
jgi:hypothetical protein